MASLSERIESLFDKADQLNGEILGLKIELSKMDGIESVEDLADVPEWIDHAVRDIGEVVGDLATAARYAKKGGQ